MAGQGALVVRVVRSGAAGSEAALIQDGCGLPSQPSQTWNTLAGGAVGAGFSRLHRPTIRNKHSGLHFIT